ASRDSFTHHQTNPPPASVPTANTAPSRINALFRIHALIEDAATLSRGFGSRNHKAGRLLCAGEAALIRARKVARAKVGQVCNLSLGVGVVRANRDRSEVLPSR